MKRNAYRGYHFCLSVSLATFSYKIWQGVRTYITDKEKNIQKKVIYR